MKRVLVAWLWLTAAACGGQQAPEAAQPDPLTSARAALDEGVPRRALQAVAKATSGPELVLRLMALIELDEWGEVERLEKSVPPGPEKAALTCMFTAQRKDVWGERRCRDAQADPKALDATLADGAQRALGRALETENRREEAEVVLKNLAAARPTNANRQAVVGFYERQGFVREAVTFVEAWLATQPDDTSLQHKLARLLERKVRGDILEKRGAEAEATARRLLALEPQHAQMRYFLADALELQGNKSGAEAERAAAKAAGAEPPKPVDSMPGPE